MDEAPVDARYVSPIDDICSYCFWDGSEEHQKCDGYAWCSVDQHLVGCACSSDEHDDD